MSGSEPEDLRVRIPPGTLKISIMKSQFSAGGVVVKGQDVLLCQHSQHHGWVFPKGLINPSTSSGRAESKEQAALREVKEETGIIGKITKPLTPVTYWFVMEGDPSTGSGQEKIEKTVYYFLMEYIGGDTKKHDHEMENVEWLPREKVKERLTYKSDQKVWEVALRAINRRLKAQK